MFPSSSSLCEQVAQHDSVFWIEAQWSCAGRKNGKFVVSILAFCIEPVKEVSFLGSSWCQTGTYWKQLWNFQNTSCNHRRNSCMCKMWLLTALLKMPQQAASAMQDKAALGYNNKVKRAVPLYYLVSQHLWLLLQEDLAYSKTFSTTVYSLIHFVAWAYLQKRQCPALDLTTSSPLLSLGWYQMEWKARVS